MMVLGAIMIGLLVTGFIYVKTQDEPSVPSSAAPGTSSPSKSPSQSPSKTPSKSPTAPATKSAAPTPKAGSIPAPDLDGIRELSEDSPRRILIDDRVDRGFDVSTEPVNGALEPSSSSEVARWSTRGQPGSPGTDTVFIVGSTDSGEAFGYLPGIKDGEEVRLRTDLGTLTYTVVKVTTGNPVSDKELSADVPGRLVLVGVGDTDLVVVANLTEVD